MKLAIVLTAVLLIASSGAGALLAVDQNVRVLWLGEDQIIESLSAWLYVLVALLLMGAGIKQQMDTSGRRDESKISYPWSLALLTACFAARELDFHSRFTGGSVLKTSYYLDASNGLVGRLAPLLVITAIALLVVRVMAKYRAIVVDRLNHGKLLGVLPIASVGLVVLSKGIDAGMGSLQRNDLLLPGSLTDFSRGVEEISELFIPCLFMAMFCLTWKQAIVMPTMIRESTSEEMDKNDSCDHASSSDLREAA